MSLSMDIVRFSLSLFLFASVVASATEPNKRFNVKDYGAVADGKSDSTQAFLTAWKQACAAEGRPRLIVPEGTFLVGPAKLKGPCKGHMVVQVKGVVLAPADLSFFPTDDWIHFQYIDGLLITGGGKFDGQGASAWPYNKCPKQKKCSSLPTSIKFSFVNNATIRGISSINSKQVHMHIFASQVMNLRYINISAPRDSPNTDGIHIGLSSNINITHSNIGTGDDCISIGPGNTNVSISNVFCGPGHGISVGSLGNTPGEGNVIGLRVRNCTLTRTTNGVRIKTWQDSPGVTLASNFTFEDIVMNNVDNPIVIDQKYCPYNRCSQQSPSLVKISNIKYRNITGVSATKVAINLICSEAVPCENVELNNINLEYSGDGEAAPASCTNVKGTSIGRVIPASCLSPSLIH